MIRRPPRSTPLYSSAASDVYKRQILALPPAPGQVPLTLVRFCICTNKHSYCSVLLFNCPLGIITGVGSFAFVPTTHTVESVFGFISSKPLNCKMKPFTTTLSPRFRAGESNPPLNVLIPPVPSQ